MEPKDVVAFPNGEIGIAWPDGHESVFEPRELRCACRCASCVDEETGVKTLRDESIPANVRALSIAPVGRYGIGIRWSDGHATGIYSYERLREICPCPTCRPDTGTPRRSPP